MTDYTQEEINLITLASFEELSYHNKFELLSGLKSTEPDFVKYESNLIKSLGDGVYNNVKAKFYNEAYRGKILDKLLKSGIKCVTYLSDGYPETLRNIACPPIVLFCKGNTELLKTRCFAIVGSRRTLPNILKECKKFSGELSKKFTIVSGMADGADSAAVEGALESGNVISVLAYGFNHFYPAVNKQLIQRVAEKGLLITEFTPQVGPKPYHFPVRNRIIAGLAEGTLIVSAGEKSGTMSTAEYSVEFGRNVYAFPYAIGVASGVGCNKLIKDGAKLVDCIDDIFTDFGIEPEKVEMVELSEGEEELFKLIKEAGEAFVADLAEKSGKLPFQLIPVLSALEIKGLIVRLGGNRYAAL